MRRAQNEDEKYSAVNYSQFRLLFYSTNFSQTCVKKENNRGSTATSIRFYKMNSALHSTGQHTNIVLTSNHHSLQSSQTRNNYSPARFPPTNTAVRRCRK